MKEALKRSGAKLAGSQKARFGMVGIVNTAVDFIVLNITAGLFGMPLVVANICSTTVAIVSSFLLNKKAVFPHGAGGTKRQFVLFIVVTFVGVWGVQGSILAVVYPGLEATQWSDAVALNVAKLVGICGGLVWNYLWYSRVVFRKRSQ